MWQTSLLRFGLSQNGAPKFIQSQQWPFYPSTPSTLHEWVLWNTNPIYEFKATQEEKAFACHALWGIMRPLRHPKPQAIQSYCFILTGCFSISIKFLVMVLFSFRKLSSVWDKWVAAGHSPQRTQAEHPSPPLPSWQLAPSACLCPSRPDHWSFGQKQGETSWVVPIFPLYAWKSYVTGS